MINIYKLFKILRNYTCHSSIFLKAKKMPSYNSKQWGEQHTKFHNQHIFSCVNLYVNKKEESTDYLWKVFSPILNSFGFLRFPKLFLWSENIKFICNYYLNS